MLREAFQKRSYHIVLIIFLGLIAYSNTFQSSFHYDDSHSIQANKRIQDYRNIPSLYWDTSGSAIVRPTTLATLALNYAVGGLNTTGYHIFNLALHISNGILLYLLILATARLGGLQGESVKFTALFASLLFVVHPIQTEAVTYIISRSILLSSFFYLSGILLFIGSLSSSKKPLYIAGMVAVSILGMTSREDFVTFPVLLIIFDYLFVSMGDAKKVISRWKVHAAVIASFSYLVYLISTFDYQSHAGFGVRNYTPMQYLFTQSKVHWTYIRMLLLPYGQNIIHDYPVSKSLFEPMTFISFLGYIGLWASGFLTYKKQPAVSFCIFWFLITLAPTSSVMPLLDIISEHRLYLPSMGFFTLISIVLFKPKNREKTDGLI